MITIMIKMKMTIPCIRFLLRQCTKL